VPNALAFDVLARDRASGTFNKISRAADGTGKKLGGLQSKVGVFSRVGTRGLGIFSTGLAAVGIGAAIAVPKILDMAGNLELMDRKAKTVFGGQIGKVETWAAANAHAMGLTSRQATGLAANFADLLIPMKFSREEATKMSTATVGLSGALAQWSGGQHSAAEVSQILASAMLGERDALKGLGISISEADVQARLAKKGQDELTGSALAQAEAIATQELIFEKSADAQAAYAKGQGTLASKVASAKASLAEMGETILVAATPALKSLADFTTNTAIPAVEGFAKSVNDNGLEIAAAFLTIADVVVTFGNITAQILRQVADNFLSFAGVIVHGAANAFGWVPGIGPKLKTAEKSFDKFQAGVLGSLDAAIAKTQSWDEALDAMRKEVKLKADIKDLQAKIATARQELKRKDLNTARRIRILGNIHDLESALRRAKGALASVHDKTVTLTVFHNTVFHNGRGGGQARQHGGPVWPGGAFVVGERRPELFVPDRPGRIVPRVPASTGVAGGGITINGGVHLHGVQNVSELVAALQRYAKNNAGIKIRAFS
jgi:hypothetical protein